MAVRVITRQAWPGKFYVGAPTLQLAVRVIKRKTWRGKFLFARKLYSWPFMVIKRQTWRGKFVALYVAHAQGRVGQVGQKDVNNSGAKPGSAMLCWLVVRFVAVITVINQYFVCMDICE